METTLENESSWEVKLRKGDSKIAFNYLDAYKVHELENLFNCRAGESICISSRYKDIGKSDNFFHSLMVMEVPGAAVPIKIRACLSYAEFIDSSNDGIEEAVMLFLTVLHGLNSSQEKVLEVSYLSFHKGRGRGSRAGWMTWFLLWNGWLNTSKRPFRKRKEPRFLCSNWFSPGPNGVFSSRGIIQAPKGKVIVCIPMREHPQILKYTLIRACEICGGHLAIRTFTDVLNRKCLLGKFKK